MSYPLDCPHCGFDHGATSCATVRQVIELCARYLDEQGFGTAAFMLREGMARAALAATEEKAS